MADVKLCECGCGEPAPIAVKTHAARGYTKGQPQRYIYGHQNRGRACRGYRQQRLPTGNHRLGTVTRAHIAIAERALGKPLPSGAHVHHVDENKRNNCNRNLVICQDMAYHSLLHFRARVIRAGGNPETQKICSSCGALKNLDDFHLANRRKAHGRQGYCKPCDSLKRNAHRKLASQATRPEAEGAPGY